MWRFGGAGGWNLVCRLWHQFWKDNVLDQAAMLSFYAILALFPLLLSLLALLGLLMQSQNALYQLIQHNLTQVAPSSASGLVVSTLRQIRNGSSSGTLSVGLLFSLYIASSSVVAMMEALNVAYGVAESRSWWKQRLVALGLTVGSLVLMAAALILLGLGARIAALISGESGEHGGLVMTGWRVLTWMLLVGFLLMAFNILYIFAPNVRHRRWHLLMPGTVLGVTVWVLVSYGFKIYLRFFNTYNTTYGSIAAVIILLMWFYLSAIAVLLGGELNSEIEKRVGEPQNADATP